MENKGIKLEWIDKLNQAKSLDELKQFLQSCHPSIQPNQLKSLIVVGAAEEGIRLIHLCRALGIEVVAWCDDNPSKQGQSIQGVSIQPTSALDAYEKNIPVIVASHRVLAVITNLRKKGFAAVAPWALLQVLAPNQFPPHMFYENWLESLFNNRDKIQKLMQMLADEKSFQVLNAIIGFRLTLNPDVLSDIIDWDLYGSEEILNLSDQEIYIDGGTFDGDTIKGFINRVNGQFKKVIGFEPDTGTFHKLESNFKHEPRVTAINKGLYSHEDTLYFDNVGTRASMLTENTEEDGIAVPVTSIDEVLQGEPVTLIKMNIEGAEIPALNGASKTIKKHKPKLGISVYHRADDLWEIPFLTQELHPDYKFYLRQHDGGVIESVMYAV